MNKTELDRLLQLFYSGDSTPEQEELLARMLSRPDDVPAGYENDARVVAAFRDAKALVPADLEQLILSATVERGHRGSRLNWRAFASLAASVAVLVALGFILMFTGREIAVKEQYAEVIIAREPVKVIFAEVEEEHSTGEVKKVRVPDQRHREIDDPVEAAAIMQAVAAKLGNTLAMADKGIETAYAATVVMANPMSAAQILD